ncbi:MAG: phosphoribosylaminoimidazolesuccinocarboxamide synthase [Bacteriovoracaceae bacterium]
MKINQCPLIYEGSVKNVRESIQNSSEYFFEYTDKYSIFDWGEMPDHIDYKGESLACFAQIMFDYLKLQGVESHAKGLVDENLEACGKSKYLKVKKVDVVRPKMNKTVSGEISYDYKVYQDKNKLQNALVPLEVIFRLGLPKGSSYLNRVKNSKFKVGDFFEEPIIEFSTKLEPMDRYVNESEAKLIAGLSESEFNNLVQKTRLIALKVRDLFKEFNIILWDGKFEFAFTPGKNPNERDVELVDAIGIDELRLTYNNIQLSKEFLRQYYKNTPWFEACNKAKELGKARGIEDWQSLCEVPPKLPREVKHIVENMYMNLTNILSLHVLKKKVFQNAIEFEQFLKEIDKFSFAKT